MTANDRLMDIARSIVKAGGSYAVQKAKLQDAIEGDAELLWEVFYRYFDAEARRILQLATPPKPKSPRGHFVDETTVSEHKRRFGVRPTDRTEYMMSKLYTFQINGKPIGEVAVSEAHNWRLHHVRDCRFVDLLLAGLPENSAKPVGKFRSPEEADACYEQAEQERQAAAD